MKLGSGKSIVVVDDSELDIRLAGRLHKKSEIENELLTFDEGALFLDFLEKVKEGTEKMPAFVLLDINMPGLNGFEVLRATRNMDDFSSSPPIYMFTTSDNPKDIERAKEFGANGFCSKEKVFNNFENSLETFKKRLENMDPNLVECF